MNRTRRSLASGLLALVASAAFFLPLGVAEAKELGTFRAWTAYEIEVQGQKVCFVESRPSRLDAKPGGRKAEAVRVTVTHRPARSTWSALLFETGYGLDEKVLADIAIDGNVYKMGTDAGGYFFVSETRDEQRLIDAMKAGSSLVAKGTMPDGTPISDTYSLLGFTAALNAIDRACPKR